MPINPFISTTYPEITRAYANKAWESLRSLLRKVSVIAGTWTAAVTVGLLPVSYTHLRAHETVLDIVCRLLLEKKTILQKKKKTHDFNIKEKFI